MDLTNWGGNYTYHATRLHRPETLEEVQQIVASAPRIRVLGTRHSFTDIADSDELMTLAQPSVATSSSTTARKRCRSTPHSATVSWSAS